MQQALLDRASIATLPLAELEQRETEISELMSLLVDGLEHVRGRLKEERTNQRQCDLCADRTKDTVSMLSGRRLVHADCLSHD